MLDPKNITVDGVAFNLTPLPALKALRLDKKILALILPVVETMFPKGGVENVGDDLNFEMLAKGVGTALEALKDSEFESLITELLSTTIYLPKSGIPQTLDSHTIDTIFQGQLLTVYKLSLEVMRYNKFTPFELLGAGSGMSKILTSAVQKATAKKSGSASEAPALLPGE